MAAVEEDGASELLFWKRLFTSNLAALGVDEDPETEEAVEAPVEVEDVEAEEVDVAVDDDDETDVAAAADGGIPVENDVVRECILPFAGTEPKDLIRSGFIVGAGAGEDEMGAEASSIDPKVTDDPGDGRNRLRLGAGCAGGKACAPDFDAFEDVRAPTPSLNATPCPNVLGRLECVSGAEGAAEGAGDCGRGDGAVEVFAGGPFAQADFDGSWVDVFGAEAVEDLLILSPE